MARRSGLDAGRRTADVSREIEAGLACHKAGREDRAEVIYRKVLRRVPGHVDALHLLGVVAHERGRHEYAVQLISRALAGKPDFAEAHLNLGCALQALGKHEKAAASYRTAARLKPDYAAAHSNLSFLLNMEEAFAAALDSAGRAVELMPELTEAHLNYGIALAGQRRFVEAEAAYRRALALQPDRAETLSQLGQTLIELRRFDEALACHRRAAELQPANATIHYRLSGALIMAGDPRGSEASCRHAISLDPNCAKAWNGLGQILRSLGRFDEARSCFRHALELDPELADAYAGLAILGERAGGVKQLQHLQRLLDGPDHPVPVRMDAGFALGMLLDNTDRYDDAFSRFAQANAFCRQLMATAGAAYDGAAFQRLIDGLIASCTPELYSMVEEEANPSEVPVFIVGMPRSGTSLVEQIAATHSRISGAGELADIAGIVDAVHAHGWRRREEELDPRMARRLADEYLAHLGTLGKGAERVIDKMPDNILHLGLVAVLFPAARVILCRRDPRDTCLSCYFRRFDQPVPWAYDLVDCGLRALELERLADHWRKVLPLRMLTIDYETLVADLEGESRRLIEFLGLGWEPACLEFHKTDRPVLTASAWQVRQPLFTRSVGRWRKYERHLGPLLERLAQGGATG